MGLKDMYRKYQQRQHASQYSSQTDATWNIPPQLKESITYFQNGQYEKAVKWLEPLANQGNPVAMNYYGRMFRDGLYFTQDLCKAFSLFEQSAAQGNAEGKVLLSGMYYRQKDYGRAIELCRQSANQGNPIATRNIGIFYENGYGVNQDYQEALKWYNLAQQRGHTSVEKDISRVQALLFD